MKPIVGYLISTKAGLIGERGQAYDYVFAKNGVFVEAEGRLLAARVPVDLCDIRGLEPVEQRVVLRYGKIPAYIFNLALSTLLAEKTKERFAAVTFEGGYHVAVPEQEGAPGRVKYAIPENVVLDLHSHPTFSMSFSGIDDQDEQGFHLYGVLADVDAVPVLHLRLGLYGYRMPVASEEIVDGALAGVTDGYALDVEEETPEGWEAAFKAKLDRGIEILQDKRKELKRGVQSVSGHDDPGTVSGRRRVWWHWWLRGGRDMPPAGQE